MRISKHALDRSKERISLNAQATARLSLKAFQQGIQVEDTAGEFNQYLTTIHYRGDPKVSAIRVYAEKVWIFKKHTLVTVYHLPLEFKNTAHKIMARKRSKIKESQELNPTIP
jgi:hypothetical protein